MRPSGVLFALSIAGIAGCSCDRPTGARDAGPDPIDAPPATTDAPIASDDAPPAIDAPADGPREDAGCGTGFALRGVPPNVLIAVPRSCYSLYPWDSSTGDLYAPTDARSVWAKMVDGIREFVETYPGRIRWGLVTFPEGPEAGAAPRCDVPPIAIEPQDGGGAMVLELLARADTPLSLAHCRAASDEFRSGPPMTAALETALTSTALHEAGRNQFVLLFSAPANDHCYDASISCDGVEAAAAALLADGIRTIALSPSQNTPTEMGCVARTGGFPLPPPGTAFPGTDFYSLPWADTVEHLVEAITDVTFSCTFPLEGTPPDADALYVFVDDVELARDTMHADGWDYDATANAVTLYGASCDRARAGEVMRLSATYGCPEPMCTPSTEICDGLDNDCNDVVDDAPGCDLI